MKSFSKPLGQVLCVTVLAAASGAAFAEMPGDTGAAPSQTSQTWQTSQTSPMPQMSQDEYAGGQAVTREQVRHELDLAIKYGVANSEEELDHWLDADVNKREHAFEAALAAERR